jgi:hypothetical protein
MVDNISAFSSGFLMTLVAPLILSHNCNVNGRYIRHKEKFFICKIQQHWDATFLSRCGELSR